MPRPTSPAFAFALFAGVIAFVLAAFSPAIFNDADTYWHIRTGEWMLDHRAILHADVFSYTRNGAPWTLQEWQSEILMALAWRAGGWSGLHILFGAAFGATAAIVGGAVRSRLDTVPALLVTLLGLACVSGSLLARPHMLALPLLAAWTWGLVMARERNSAPSWWLLLIMPLWVNLHGTFAFGLALAVALAAEASFMAANKRQTALRWGGFVAAALTLCLINPQHWHGLLFPLHLTAMKGLGHIGEWAATDFSAISPFELALLAVLFAGASGKVKLPLVRLLILLGLTHLALQHTRHQMLFGVCGSLLIAPFLVWPAKNEKTNPLLAYAAMALLAMAMMARALVPASHGQDPMTPAAALAHVPPALRQQPVLNDYGFGGYLIWRGVKPFIDSRADMYGDAFLDQYAAVTAPDAKLLAATLSRHHVRWTIFAAGAPVAKLLDATPGWRRLYGDDIAVVHVKD